MIKQALSSYAQASAKIWSTDRSQTVGASDLGQCARKTFWIKNEGDPEYGAARDLDYVDGWGAKVRGSFYEDHFWVPAMRAQYGNQLKWAGAEQNTFVSGFLSATPDALIGDLKNDALSDIGVSDIESDCIVSDCKTIDPRSNLDGPKAENEFQIQVQLGLVRELTNWKPVWGLLSYTNASFWDDIVEFPIRFNPVVYEGAKKRAALIMTATSPRDLKPEGWIAGGYDCENCPFTRACGIVRRSVPEKNAAADPQFIAEMADLAIIAKHLEKTRDDNDAKLRETQQEIRDRMRSHGVKKIPGLINWSYVKGRTGYDNKAIQAAAVAAGIDIEKFSTVGDPTDRLTVSLPDSTSSGVDKSQTASAA